MSCSQSPPRSRVLLLLSLSAPVAGLPQGAAPTVIATPGPARPAALVGAWPLRLGRRAEADGRAQLSLASTQLFDDGEVGPQIRPTRLSEPSGRRAHDRPLQHGGAENVDVRDGIAPVEKHDGPRSRGVVKHESPVARRRPAGGRERR